MAFAVHGISELSFAGAAAGLLLGVGVVEGSLVGSLIAAALIGLLGSRARDRNSIIAVLMPFGLGLGILCLALYPGPQREQVRPAHRADRRGRRPASSARSRVIALDRGDRPVRRVAPADLRQRGCRRRRGARRAGARPLARLHAAARPRRRGERAGRRRTARALGAGHSGGGGDAVSSSPVVVPVLSTVFAVVSLVGGILLALGSSVPISPYVTTISFLIYVVCRSRSRGGRGTAVVGAD